MDSQDFSSSRANAWSETRYTTSGYCGKCGAPLGGTTAFCSNCGAPQSGAAAAGVPSGTYPPQYPQQSYPSQPYGQPYVAQQYPAGAGRKDPGVAIVLSFLWTGLGQLYVGEEATNRGIVLAVVTLFLLMAYATIIGLVFLLVGLPLWIWGMVDANNAAKAYNARRGMW
jgi:TM2 domain-containing membrane protein YozV